MYQILSVCFLYPEEKNLSILKSPDFQEHEKDLMLCYEGIDDGVELKRCLKEVQGLFRVQPSKSYKGYISVLSDTPCRKSALCTKPNMAQLTYISKCMSWVIFKVFIKPSDWISLM